MNIPLTVNQTELLDVLLNVAVTRPIFIWGAPGIGKSSIVESFADSVGIPCVSMLGSQLAPEDIIGVPQIIDGKIIHCGKLCRLCRYPLRINAGQPVGAGGYNRRTSDH